jgi:hypothetical protein
MSELRGWSIYAWVALPTVMYGGYALLGLLTKTNALTPFGRTWFRAGHAHAGVMLLMALLFFDYLSHTRLSLAAKHIACGTFVAGILGAVLLTIRHCDTGLCVILRSRLNELPRVSRVRVNGRSRSRDESSNNDGHEMSGVAMGRSGHAACGKFKESGHRRGGRASTISSRQ